MVIELVLGVLLASFLSSDPRRKSSSLTQRDRARVIKPLLAMLTMRPLLLALDPRAGRPWPNLAFRSHLPRSQLWRAEIWDYVVRQADYLLPAKLTVGAQMSDWKAKNSDNAGSAA